MPQLMLDKAAHRQAARGRSAAVNFLTTAFDSDLGWMAVAQHDEVLAGVVFGHASKRQAVDALEKYLVRNHATALVDLVDLEDQPRSIRSIVARLERYAAGEPVEFGDVVIDELHLTPFGRRIVSVCRRIPRGVTQSYGELAAQGGSPGAARAVGQVMAKNRCPLVVPCHRVLASGGDLGGFSAPQGLAMKRRLLELEGAMSPTSAG